MRQIVTKAILGAIIITQVFGAIFLIKPNNAEAQTSGIGAITALNAVPGTAVAIAVPSTNIFDFHKFQDDIFKQMMLGIAYQFAQNFMQRFLDRLTEKYKIRNFLYYDQILSNYYLTSFIRDKITDPDLRQIYSLMESAYITGQPNGTTPGTSGVHPSRAVVPRLRTAIAELYIKQTGTDPARLYNPPQDMPARDYLDQAQLYYFTNPGYVASNLHANFGAYQANATTAAQLEVLVGNSLKAGRFIGGHCDIVGQRESQGQNSDISTPERCTQRGGTWRQSALDQARSFIDNPSASIDKWMNGMVLELTGSNFDPNNFWFTVGTAFGRFLNNRLMLDRGTGVLQEDPRGYSPEPNLGQGTLGGTPIDNDGDGMVDGYDINGDGEMDTCVFGGTAPNCDGSSDTTAGGGGGTTPCSGIPMPIQYEGEVLSAQAEVNSTNPNGVADALNTSANSIAYLNEVANVLISRGYQATTNVRNGNNNPNRGDLIVVWQTGSVFAERYDAVIDAGGATQPMRDAATTQYVNHVEIGVCVNQ